MPGRGTYRGVYANLIDDPDFQRLTSESRHLFLTIRLSQEIGPSGIFRFYPGPFQERTGYTARKIEQCLRELEQPKVQEPLGWIVREEVIMWVVNALRHDPCNRLSDEKHRKAIQKTLLSLPRLQIVLTYCDYYRIPRPFEAPSKTLPIVRHSEQVSFPSPSPSLRSPDTSPSPQAVEESDQTPALDPALAAILSDCPFLSLVNNGASAGFWDQVLGACEPYPLADSRWLGAKLRQWNEWFAGNPSRRSRDRKRLQTRLMGWLARDLERLARSRA